MEYGNYDSKRISIPWGYTRKNMSSRTYNGKGKNKTKTKMGKEVRRCLWGQRTTIEVMSGIIIIISEMTRLANERKEEKRRGSQELEGARVCALAHRFAVPVVEPIR
jgi:hypothetical protein